MTDDLLESMILKSLTEFAEFDRWKIRPFDEEAITSDKGITLYSPDGDIFIISIEEM